VGQRHFRFHQLRTTHPAEMKNIGIFGIGCIGSILVKYLQQNPAHNYYYFNRSPRSQINIHYNDSKTIIPISLSKEIPAALDWLLVCLKEYQLKAASAELKKCINPATKIAVFRNGIHLADSFLEYTSSEQILETIISCPTQRNEQTELIQYAPAHITLPSSPLSQTFMNLFASDEIEWLVTDDFRTAQWKKLIESSALGAIQVLYKLPCVVFKEPVILEEYKTLLREAVKVAQSEGILLPKEFVNHLVHKLHDYPDTKGSSMLSDVLAGRQLELDAKIGAIIKTGLKNKINLPSTNRVYRTLLEINQELGK